MRDAGRVVARAIEQAARLIQPGVRTRELDAAIEATFAEAGADPLFKGVPGVVPFPAVSCISVNEEVVHGIPGDRILEAGDLVSIDTGCRLAGWCADSAWTYPVGAVDDRNRRLLETGQRVLELAIAECGRKQRWSEVAAQMAETIRQAGFSNVEDFVGHGIGREMHEDPQVPNYVSRALLSADIHARAGPRAGDRTDGERRRQSSRNQLPRSLDGPDLRRTAERPFRAHGGAYGGGTRGPDGPSGMISGR